MPDLTTFESVRREAYKALGDAEDGLNYRGPGWPAGERQEALLLALHHIAAAKRALNEAAE
jgi:hypothetical protein